jgi:K+-transporting ATPase ATPase A chain
MAVAVALIRGFMRHRAETIGNFWVDLTRGVTRVLLPLALVLAVVLAGLGVVQTLQGPARVTTVEGATQTIYRGPIASQESIKELGTNGGGIVNANSAHPFENPTGVTNFLEILALLLIPFALTYAFGRLVRDQRQGWAIFFAMFALWAGAAATATYFEVRGNPRVEVAAVNMEGKEVRFGAATSALFAASTTGTSTGAVDSSHDSFTPGGGAVPLVNMLLGEVSPGGVGAGLYGMLIFVLLAVFISGLMVGRTPEYLGKKVQAAEMKLVVLYLLAVPILVLVLAGVSVVFGPAKESILNPGPHGLSEVVYAFASQANNNGSAFAGLTGNTDWYNTTGALAMLAGRFFLIVPVLAIAGSLARKQTVPPSAGTLPTHGPLFVVMLLAVIVIIVGLTYFPVLALGPIVEQLAL